MRGVELFGILLQKGDLSFLGLILILVAVVVIFFLALILGFWIYWRIKRSEGKNWAACARSLGFDLKPSTFDNLSSLVPEKESIAQPMTGIVDGRAATVSVRREHWRSHMSGMRRGRVVYHTSCNIRFRNPKMIGFSITSRKLLDALIEGPNAFRLGYADFDRMYRVESQMPQAMFAVLAQRASDNVAPAEQFVRFASSDWTVSASDSEVFAGKRGIVTDADEIRRILAMLSDLATRLEFGIHQTKVGANEADSATRSI